MKQPIVNEMLDAARRSGLDPRTIADIEELVQLALVEERLRAEGLGRLLRVTGAAERALGKDAGWRWLRRYNRNLGAVPLDRAAEDDKGAAAVEKHLGQIEHGVYS